jgi:hypothetical protein
MVFSLFSRPEFVMHDPISSLFVKNSSQNLAMSALPCAPVLPEQRSRRRGGMLTLRRTLRRSHR